MHSIDRRMVDELWIYGTHISEGMKLEIVKAQRCGIQVVIMSQNILPGDLISLYKENGLVEPKIIKGVIA